MSEWGDEWMEQEIIIKWCEKHGLKVGAKEKELMEIFTNIRINNICQLQAEKARADELSKKNGQLEARVAEMVEVLEFYADRNTYFAARKALAKAKEA